MAGSAEVTSQAEPSTYEPVRSIWELAARVSYEVKVFETTSRPMLWPGPLPGLGIRRSWSQLLYCAQALEEDLSKSCVAKVP